MNILYALSLLLTVLLFISYANEAHTIVLTCILYNVICIQKCIHFVGYNCTKRVKGKSEDHVVATDDDNDESIGSSYKFALDNIDSLIAIFGTTLSLILSFWVASFSIKSNRTSLLYVQDSVLS